ncbi:hypothetical protein EVAR_52879_1 [Eumeta japonica]|uniref:Uncharacterized protein n=1 Tax=Eumeta variegata TaxID=151549 RepID=A0A4C1YP14_EUMVA|nr:hypothetical protein EVAR_52879_1 [Eumeta japonica]
MSTRFIRFLSKRRKKKQNKRLVRAGRRQQLQMTAEWSRRRGRACAIVGGARGGSPNRGGRFACPYEFSFGPERGAAVRGRRWTTASSVRPCAVICRRPARDTHSMYQTEQTHLFDSDRGARRKPQQYCVLDI